MLKDMSKVKFLIVIGCLIAAMITSCREGDHSCVLVDYPALISTSDLIYTSPESALESHAIGNGIMGTMVWTTPASINFQINRNDVFAVNKDHIGLQFDSVDYCGGCASVKIDLGGEPFSGKGKFKQILSLYNAEDIIDGNGVVARCFVFSQADVIVVEIDDQRSTPQPLELTVSMWREPNVITPETDPASSGYHQAHFDFNDSIPQTILMSQQFNEHFDPQYQKGSDYHCRSAVAARISGDIMQIQSPDNKTRRIIAPAQLGRRVILISSAASFSKSENVGATAIGLLDTHSDKPYSVLQQRHITWWHDFWSRTFVDLSSDDGSAEQWENVRNLHLYYMASSSRGDFPPKWNGSIFSVAGDSRSWGAQYWVWPTESLYWPLLASDAIDLTNPFFDMYVGQLPAASQVGPQRWGVSEGAYYPETAAFDGPVVLPEAVGAEFRDVLYGDKPGNQLSDLGKAMCQYCGHLRVLSVSPDRFRWISHVTSSGSELAIHAWWRYRYTDDKQWLATHAYPLLKNTVEFYLNFAQLGDDGRYHIIGTNTHEDYWGADNSVYDIAAIRSTVPVAIRASEILGVDTDLRIQWQKFLDNLAPYVMGSDSGALGALADDAWAAGRHHFVEGSHNSEDCQLAPIFPFESWTLETNDVIMDSIAQKTVDMAPRFLSIHNGASCNTAIRSPIAWIKAGRSSKMPAILSNYYSAFSPMINGMSMFEGQNAHSVEHLGILTHTLQEGLLQSVSPLPGQPEIITVFPAWPRMWDASFSLLARGGFKISSAVRDGQVEFIEVESRFGEPCRLRNPWGKACVVTEIDGRSQLLSGEILKFNTKQGKHYKVLAQGVPKPAFRSIIPSTTTEPLSYSLPMTNTKRVRERKIYNLSVAIK